MAANTTNPERLAVLTAELASVDEQRQRLRDICGHNEVVSFALDEDLARRGWPGSGGQAGRDPDVSQRWDAALAPLREALKAT